MFAFISTAAQGVLQEDDSSSPMISDHAGSVPPFADFQFQRLFWTGNNRQNHLLSMAATVTVDPMRRF
jgi:hypothetical protein